MADVVVNFRARDLTRGQVTKLKNEVDRLKREFNAAEDESKRFRNRLVDMRSTFRNVAIGAGAFTAGLTLVGRGLVNAAIQMEGFRNGLTALEGDANIAATRLQDLQELAQLPGVSLQGAIQGAIRLKTVGIEAGLADASIREFANALALVGSTDLSGALLGLTQILSRGRVAQEEINQIVERSGLISKALQEAFGTIQAEQIQSQLDAAGKSVQDFTRILVNQLGTFARVPADSAANAIQNLRNAVFQLNASLGEVLLPTVTQIVQGLTNMVNAFNNLSDGTKTAIVTIGAIVTALGAATTAVATLGFVISSFQAGLVVFAEGGALAGVGTRLAALASPAVLTGIGTVAAALVPLGIAYNNYRGRVAEAREQERTFAEQIAKTAQVIRNRSGFAERIDELRTYIETLSEASNAYNESLGGGAGRALGLLADSGPTGDRQAHENRQERIRISERELAILNNLNKGRELTLDQLREFDQIVATNLRQAQLRDDAEAVGKLEEAAKLVVKEFQRLEQETIQAASRIPESVAQAGTSLRNFRFEVIELGANVRDAQDAFSDVANISELETATQSLLRAQQKLTETKLDEIDAEIDIEGAALSRLSNSERASSEHYKKLIELATQRRQIVLQSEYDETRIKRQEVSKRTQFEEEYAQQVIEYGRRVAEARRIQQQERANELRTAAQQIGAIENEDDRTRLSNVFGGLLAQDVVPAEALRRAQNAVDVIEGISNSLNSVEPAARAVAAAFSNRLVQGIQTVNGYWGQMGEGIRETREALLELGIAIDDVARQQQAVRLIEVETRIQEGQAERDQTTRDRFQTGADTFNENERRTIAQGQTFVARLRSQQLAGEQGEIGRVVAEVPEDIIRATLDSLIAIPRQLEQQLEQLDQVKLDRIADINEEERLSAAEKAQRILEIERDFARRRIQIEQDANQAKIDSFRAVVTNFIGGIGRMIAEQLKLRAATAVTNSLFGNPQTGTTGLLGGLGAGVSAVNPLLGLGLAGGAAVLSSLFSGSFDDPVNDALARRAGMRQGVTALFSGSFHDPINDALARQAGMQQSQLRAATAIGRRSAVDLKDNFEQGFVQSGREITRTPRDTGEGAAIRQRSVVDLKDNFEQGFTVLSNLLNDALARQAGMQQSQLRAATAIGQTVSG